MSESPLRRVLVLHLEMGPAKQVKGDTSEIRMIYDVRGGRFHGDGVRGRIMPVMGDWVSVVDGSVTMDVRVKLQTEEGDTVMMSYDSISALEPGLQHLVKTIPGAAISQHYFRVQPVFETRSPALQWLGEGDTFAIGVRYDTAMEYYVYQRRTSER